MSCTTQNMSLSLPLFSFLISNNNFQTDTCTYCVLIRESKQIVTAGADTAAGSRFPQKCATAHVRWLHTAVSMKSDYMSRDVSNAVVATTSSLFSGPFQQTFWYFENSIGYYIL